MIQDKFAIARRAGPIERGNSVGTALQQLRSLIVSGRLAPGAWIIEEEIAERFGLSRTPVRGALQALQKEGYVISSSNGAKARMTVAPLTKEDARELYAIIGHLEGLSGRQAALLPDAGRATLIARLKKINATLARYAKTRRPEPNSIFECDLGFHRAIVESNSGPRLTALHRAIQPQAERYWRLYASAILDELSLSVAEHAEIIEGMQQGDPDRVERGLQLNWRNGVDRLSRVIDAFGERGTW